jgi:hypothetical protein
MYIIWQQTKGILFVTSDEKKIFEYIKNKDAILEVDDYSIITQFSSYDKDETIYVSELTSDNNDDNGDDIWVLEYKEDNGGGSYHSQVTWYVNEYNVLREIINDILECEHNRSDCEPCEDCPSCVNDMNIKLDRQDEEQEYSISGSSYESLSFRIKKLTVT